VIRGVQSLAGYPIMQTRVAGIEINGRRRSSTCTGNRESRFPARAPSMATARSGGTSIGRCGAEDYEPRGLRWASDYDCQRPRLIQIYNSSNVDLQGLRLERSGFWTVHICYSRKVTVDGVTIRNNIGGKGPSTDGIDVDSSSDVLVEHCDIECNDDAICLKAGRDSDGLRVNRPTEHVTIRDNTVRAGRRA